MSAPPPLRIGLPVRNGERYLPAALGSLLGQTFGDFELVICDNASSDGTEAICREAAARDSRVAYQKNPEDIGASPNFNKTFEGIQSPLFKWAAHDDVCEPTCLERCVAALEAAPDAVLAQGATLPIDAEGAPVLAPLPEGFHATQRELARRGLIDPLRLIADASPVTRFREQVLRSDWCYEIFGVVRTDALRGTPLLASFYGGDHTLLAELALKG
ncbi:MAG: glycosyltransferase family 2 protein, partial [Planctomycetota bacterium]